MRHSELLRKNCVIEDCCEVDCYEEDCYKVDYYDLFVVVAEVIRK